MSRSRPRSVRNHLPGAALLFSTIASLLVAPPADAGIGNPLKKVKEKVAKSVERTAAPEAAPAAGPVEFDDVVLELTNERIEGILATFRNVREARAGRPALVQTLDKKNDERGKFAEKHWEAIQALRMKRSEVETCYHDGYQAAQDRRTEEYQAKALTDPIIREKFARAAQENNAAAARGDSAAIQRIMKTLHEVTAPTREDSIQVRQSCGPLPPHSREEERLDAMDAELATLNEQVRQIDTKVADAQAKEGGLTRQQWGMALDRIEAYLAMRQDTSSSPPPPQGFSPVELEALEKHHEELRAALR